jgi:hypothetical protein
MKLTLEQVWAVAAFEREHGAARVIPPGPRREHIAGHAGPDVAVVESAPVSQFPVVAIIWPGGGTQLLRG